MMLILPGMLGFGHYMLLAQHIFGFWITLILKIIFMLLSFGFMYMVWDSYKNTSWAVIKEASE
jgi:hypothetical protein